MAHDKVYGVCENKCFVEVLPKNKTVSKDHFLTVKGEVTGSRGEFEFYLFAEDLGIDLNNYIIIGLEVSLDSTGTQIGKVVNNKVYPFATIDRTETDPSVNITCYVGKIQETVYYKLVLLNTDFSNSESDLPEIVSFADGTTDQILDMLEAHYRGDIEISDYWNVGDKRAFSLSSMTATGVGESHHSANYEFMIADFGVDKLQTPIGVRTHAAVALTMVGVLRSGATEYAPNSDSEAGTMNESYINDGGWKDSNRRTWCNEVFFNALPALVRENIKPVVKYTDNVGGNTQSSTNVTATIDKVFLPSEYEVLGVRTYANPEEQNNQIQYKCFKAEDPVSGTIDYTKQYKLPPSHATTHSADYWTRSTVYGKDKFFINLGENSSTERIMSYESESYLHRLFSPMFNL